ncbi:MAG: DUF4350 domain-containing protein, partial [Chitinophagaceae bacterium]
YTDKIPYGTYIVYNQLKELFTEKPELLRMPVYDKVNNSEDSGEVYTMVASDISTNGTDEKELLIYISRGNTVLMAAENFSSSLQDTLNVKVKSVFYTDMDKDSVSLMLVNPNFGKQASYQMQKHTVDGYFSEFDSAKTTVLGMNNKDKINFIRIDIGKGHLFLHAAPMAFTNYFMLTGNNSRYIEQALSYLPEDATAVYWDEYYKIGRGGPTTPLRVILSKPPLKAAYFLALASIILFILFRSKRKQRIIPILERPRNTTMDFVETVSRVYYNQQNHRNIALKKVTYLLDNIRSKYGLQTQNLDATFEKRLAQKSGVPIEQLREMVSMVHRVRSNETVLAPELMHLSRLIDEFYKSRS